MKKTFLGIVVLIALSGCGSSNDSSESKSVSSTTSSSKVESSSSKRVKEAVSTEPNITNITKEIDLTQEGSMNFDKVTIKPQKLIKGEHEGYSIFDLKLLVKNETDEAQTLNDPNFPIMPTISEKVQQGDNAMAKHLPLLNSEPFPDPSQYVIPESESVILDFYFPSEDLHTISISVSQYEGKQYSFDVQLQ